MLLKCQKIVLRQIIDWSKWGLRSFFQIHHTIIWPKFKSCVCIFLFKNIFVVLVLNRDVMLLRPKIKGWNGIHKECISLLCYLYECSCFHKQKMKCLDPWLLLIFPSHLSFYMCWLIFIGFSCVDSCSESNVLIGKVSYFGHYYILCPFAKGQTKNLKVLRKKNKKPKGFAKEKKFAKFVMQNALQLAAHHSLQI